jgi:hypothetical protein
VEILAVQLSKREAELLQQKDEVTKLAKSLKQVCLLLHNLSKCDDQYFQNLVLILLEKAKVFMVQWQRPPAEELLPWVQSLGAAQFVEK